MSNRYEKGMDVMKVHVGPQAESYIQAIREVAPLFADVNVEFAFGDLYGHKSSLSDQQRELITIGALTVMGHALPQLKLHIEAALRIGVTQAEIVESITQMIAYCGFPAATNAILAAKDVFDAKAGD